MSKDDVHTAREKGRHDATELMANEAPGDPVLRVAWAAGYGQVDLVKLAVEEARAAGVSWRRLGDAMGMNFRTVQSKYSQQERNKRYRERQRAREQGEDQ